LGNPGEEQEEPEKKAGKLMCSVFGRQRGREGRQRGQDSMKMVRTGEKITSTGEGGEAHNRAGTRNGRGRWSRPNPGDSQLQPALSGAGGESSGPLS